MLFWLLLLFISPCYPFFFSVQSERHSTALPLQKVTLNICGRQTGGDALLWEGGYAEYTKRLARSAGSADGVALSTVFHKSDGSLSRSYRSSIEGGKGIIVLDNKDSKNELCSNKFAQALYEQLERGGSRLDIFIGGMDGLPKDITDDCLGDGTSNVKVISLGKMTFTHHFCRVIIAEQIYRGREIRRGSKYHK